MNVYLLCSALLVLLYFALGLRVSIERRRSGIGLGIVGDGKALLDKVVRAHGNAAEYVPLLVAIFLYFSTRDVPVWVAAVAVLLTLCRFLHALGMLLSPTLNRAQPLRFVGALGTYLGGLALGLALLLQAL